MSSRPRQASLPAEGGPSSWSFVIRASATELVRAPAGLQVGGPLADSTHVSRSFSPPVAVFPPAARVSAPAGGRRRRSHSARRRHDIGQHDFEHIVHRRRVAGGDAARQLVAEAVDDIGRVRRG